MIPLLLAWEGSPRRGRGVRGTWDEIVSMIVCGETGSGKTWTVVSYCTQAVRSGMLLAVGDPHAGNRSSLASRLAPLSPWMWRPMATNKRTCLVMAQAVQAELRRRQEEGERLMAQGKEWTLDTHGDKPIVLVLDEFNALMRMHGKKLGDIAKEISEEGRKFFVHMIASGQHWTVEAMGSSELRDTIPTAVVHRCRKTMAAMVCDRPQAEVEWAPKLGDGQVYISMAGSETITGPYHVPPMTQEDVAAVAILMSEPELRPQPAGLIAPVKADRGREVPRDVRDKLLAERQRVIALFRDPANSPGQVGMIVLGRKPSEQGFIRNAACRMVEDIVRDELLRLESLTVEQPVRVIDRAEHPLHIVNATASEPT